MRPGRIDGDRGEAVGEPAAGGEAAGEKFTQVQGFAVHQVEGVRTGAGLGDIRGFEEGVEPVAAGLETEPVQGWPCRPPFSADAVTLLAGERDEQLSAIVRVWFQCRPC